MVTKLSSGLELIMGCRILKMLSFVSSMDNLVKYGDELTDRHTSVLNTVDDKCINWMLSTTHSFPLYPSHLSPSPFSTLNAKRKGGWDEMARYFLPPDKGEQISVSIYRIYSTKQNVPTGEGDFCKKTARPSSVLTEEEENTLSKWIVDSSNKGFPQRKDNVLVSVKEFLQLNYRPNPFKDNTPGVGWYRAFHRRHPELASRTSEGVTTASGCVTWKKVQEEKAQKKQKGQEEKHERKRKREEKNLINKEENGLKKKKCGKKIAVNDVEQSPVNIGLPPQKCGLCYVCARNIKFSKGEELECSMCNKLFHVRCLPTHHKHHVPDNEDADSFVFHNCYNVNDHDCDDASCFCMSDDGEI
ncbi:hypothetical protein C0J52_26996 [Blattella germanica]|nr:hypothetical protein C0J52_26996 [Blattella germanica]